MLQPQRAIVVPRARRTPGGAALPLQSLIEPLLAKCRTGVIQIVGPAMSGKTTALQHLAAVLPKEKEIAFLDEPKYERWKSAGKKAIAILVTRTEVQAPHLGTFLLAPWTIDDCIEYLAAEHRPHVDHVVNLIREDARFANLGGVAGLVRIVLDGLVGDPSLDNSLAALRAFVIRATADQSPRPRVTFHPVMERIREANAIADDLRKPNAPAHFLASVSREIFPELAAAIRADSLVLQNLESILHGPNRIADAMAASLLLEANPNWRPWAGRPLNLMRSLLAGAKWSCIDLQESIFTAAHVQGADLSDAVLNRINAIRADFSNASLRRARLVEMKAGNAVFADADMQGVDASQTDLMEANLSGARLIDAKLAAARLHRADLTNADLSQASLYCAWLDRAIVRGANFSRANCTEAHFCEIDMRRISLDAARFTRAKLCRCNLSGLRAKEVEFDHTILDDSYLTGTHFPEANFFGASLRNTGLAEITWEGADLRLADLTGASFHLGSTRSGLVGSPIACEGSRTGFYTDEFDEQDFKSPEEIRKANLCGADLRGAKVEGVDFYLVDLRGAKYTPDQAEHFAKCGAILRSRVA
jgi:uncharacterized protein YjbI with pentapeptide repeats